MENIFFFFWSNWGKYLRFSCGDDLESLDAHWSICQWSMHIVNECDPQQSERARWRHEYGVLLYIAFVGSAGKSSWCSRSVGMFCLFNVIHNSEYVSSPLNWSSTKFCSNLMLASELCGFFFFNISFGLSHLASFNFFIQNWHSLSLNRYHNLAINRRALFYL